MHAHALVCLGVPGIDQSWEFNLFTHEWFDSGYDLSLNIQMDKLKRKSKKRSSQKSSQLYY